MTIEIRPITAKVTYPIRHSELRQGLPIESCQMQGDDDITTLHLGAFEHQKLVGVVSLMKTDEKEYQLRGMAVLSEYQGKKIGKFLVEHAEKELLSQNVTALWMNARIKAVPFYEKLGYQKTSDVFMIEGVGEHIRMEKS